MTDTYNPVLDNVAQSNSDWIQGACVLVQQMPQGHYTGEDIRFHLTEIDYPPPTHCNVWGVLTNVLIKRHLLEPTGIYQASIAASSNKTKIQLYRLTP